MKRLVVLALLVLAGCESPAQIAAQQAAQATQDDAVCRSYGFEYGKPGYPQCRMTLAQRRDVQQSQEEAALAQALVQATARPSNPVTTCSGYRSSVSCITTK